MVACTVDVGPVPPAKLNRVFSWMILGVLLGAAGGADAAAQAPSLAVEASTVSPSAPADSNGVATTAGTADLVRALLLEHLPRDYENAKHWGQTKPRWDGVKVSLDGLRVKTKRRWKEVNHGTWTRYKAWLIDPQNQFAIHFSEPRPTRQGRVAFDLVVDMRLGGSGRLSEWNYGVQLYSFSADAEAKVRLQMTCEVGLKLDAGRFPPDVVLDPMVTHAQLDLLEFHLHRISNADGPLIHELGDNLRGEVQDEINRRREKLVERINRAINKSRDTMRLSLESIVTSGWQTVMESEGVTEWESVTEKENVTEQAKSPPAP